MNNQEIARRLEEIAHRLGHQGASRFRTEAYAQAAQAVKRQPQPVAEILRQGGRRALLRIPSIGEGISAVIEEMVLQGRSRLLDRLREGDDPERLFRTLPGIGRSLAARLHRDLGVETLEELETACHGGRIESVAGFGPGRVEALRAVLEHRLRRPPAQIPDSARPPVELLLEVDRIYREGAEQDHFRRVAPRRFNPEKKAWLPIAHIDRGGWHFTALYSNTALAHQLHRTHDWVILYFYDGDHREGQCTVVTEHRGPLAGNRVVRGRESEITRPPAARSSGM